MPYKNKIIKFVLTKISKLFESDNLIIIIGVLSILPFLIISIFINPSADDFCYNNISRDVGYWNTQLDAYNGWTGRYFSTAVLSIRALVSGSFIIYKIIPVILLILLFISIYHLSSSIFLTLKKRNHYILTFFILTLYLIQMPAPSEGFYWLAASITYQLSIILSIFLISFFIKYLETHKKKYLIISILFSFLVIGLNEISMLFINSLIGVVFIYKSIQKQKINYPISILLIFMVIFSIIVIFSPGSAARGGTYPNNHQFFYSIYKTISATKSNLGDWLPTIIVFLLIFFEYFDKNISLLTPKIFIVNPFIPFIIVFSVPFIALFPIYWSLNWVPSRSVNLIYFFFLIGLIYLTFVLYFKLKSENSNFLSYTKWVKYFLFILIFIRLGENNNIRIAYSDLLSGRAYKYDRELRDRYKAIQNNEKDTLVIPKLTSLPKTIHFEDIRSNPKHWINQCYKSYFNQKEIILKSNID